MSEVFVSYADKDKAFDLLEPALAKGGKTLVGLASADRNLDALRDDLRFQKMLEAAQKRAGVDMGGHDLPLKS